MNSGLLFELEIDSTPLRPSQQSEVQILSHCVTLYVKHVSFLL